MGGGLVLVLVAEEIPLGCDDRWIVSSHEDKHKAPSSTPPHPFVPTGRKRSQASLFLPPSAGKIHQGMSTAH